MLEYDKEENRRVMDMRLDYLSFYYLGWLSSGVEMFRLLWEGGVGLGLGLRLELELNGAVLGVGNAIDLYTTSPSTASLCR